VIPLLLEVIKNLLPLVPSPVTHSKRMETKPQMKAQNIQLICNHRRTQRRRDIEFGKNLFLTLVAR
jgi:hypothetical protein